MVSTQLKNAEILKLVGEQFPEAKTTAACIAWYRSDLKKKPQIKPVEEPLTVSKIEEEIFMLEGQIELLKLKKEKLIEDEKATKMAELKKYSKEELEAMLEAMQE